MIWTWIVLSWFTLTGVNGSDTITVDSQSIGVWHVTSTDGLTNLYVYE